jgi:hypothetical protein
VAWKETAVPVAPVVGTVAVQVSEQGGVTVMLPVLVQVIPWTVAIIVQLKVAPLE